MAAKKKTAAKKAPKKKATAAKKKAAPKKKAGAKKAASKKAAPKKAVAKKKVTATKKVASKKQKTPTKRTAPGKGAVSSTDVNLGHVFALKPRANTSFRQNDFMTAKRALRDEPYASIPEAARAVAEEALSLTRGDSTKIELPSRR